MLKLQGSHNNQLKTTSTKNIQCKKSVYYFLIMKKNQIKTDEWTALSANHKDKKPQRQR